MKLTEREVTELLFHLVSAAETWTPNEETPGLWMREENGSLWALLLEETLEVHALPTGELTQEAVDAFLERLLREWTDYGRRARMQETLESAGVADPAGLALTLCTEQRSSHTHPTPLTTQREGDVCFKRIEGGGYVRLTLRNGVLFASISLPSAGEQAYGPPVEGVVEPYDGRSADSAARIAGWDEWTPYTPEVLPKEDA